VADLLSAKQSMFKSKFDFLFFLCSATLLVFISACKKETEVSPSLSFNYFPSEKGRWVEYIVDSTYHAENDNENDDSVYYYHFQIREEIDSSFIDGAGITRQILKRFRRIDSTEQWTLTDVWTQSISLVSAYRIENNVPFHKLAFPISLSKTWNGNDANTLDEEDYSYESIHEPDSYNSLQFDSTITVLQIDENNYIEKIYGTEVYANGVGLVYKVRDELGKRNGVVVKGMEYTMKVINYGKN
jgi:hypothetical protein